MPQRRRAAACDKREGAVKKRGTNAAENTARGYDEGLAAIRLEGIAAGPY